MPDRSQQSASTDDDFANILENIINDNAQAAAGARPPVVAPTMPQAAAPAVAAPVVAAAMARPQAAAAQATPTAVPQAVTPQAAAHQGGTPTQAVTQQPAAQQAALAPRAAAQSGAYQSGYQELSDARPYSRGQARRGNSGRLSERGARYSAGDGERTSTRGAYKGYSLDGVKAKHGKLKYIIIGILAVLVVAALAVVGYNMINGGLFAGSTVEAGIDKEIFIAEGSSSAGIAKQLKDEGIIQKENSFLAAVKERGVETLLKPGKYLFVTGSSDSTVIDLLVAGPNSVAGVTLTIPEGYTVEQTAAAVEKACGIPAADFIAEAHSADKYYAADPQKYAFLANVYNNSLEGFLYPKTYGIPQGSDAAYVVRVLLDQFVTEMSGFDMSYAESRNLNLYDVMIIASMVERETFTEGEREQVSAVLYNRLRSGMKLQICATVVYALGPDERDYGVNPLLYVDLEVDSPYNTYIHDGLPPGPICSPQIASIKAAAHPAQSDYLYYVLTSQDGKHTFCTTDEEFAAANAVYQEVFGVSS